MNKKKRELEHNELADAIDSYYEQIKPYLPRIFTIAVVIILAVVAVAVWLFLDRRNAESQWSAYLDARRYADQRGMGEVAKVYPDKPAGQFAMMQAADYDYNRGMSKMVSDRADFQDKLQKAIDRYEVLVGDEYQVPAFVKRRALFALGHSYECLGEFDRARDLYQRLVDEAPDSSITIMARTGIRRLSEPGVVGIYEQFRKWSPEMTGPGTGPLLPERPNINFPAAGSGSPDGTDAGAGTAADPGAPPEPESDEPAPPTTDSGTESGGNGAASATGSGDSQPAPDDSSGTGGQSG